jgi:hypothetical protein
MKATLPITKNYPVYMGDTFNGAPVTIKINGTAADISGDTFRIRIIEAGSGTTFATLELGSGITNPSGSRVQWKLTKTQTAAMVAKRKYLYDYQWTKANGDNVTLYVGELNPIKDITP